MSKLSLYLLIALGVLLVGGYVYVRALQNENAQLKLDKLALAQNVQAGKDLANAHLDKVTILTAFVDDLNTKLTKKDREIVALKATISSQIDTIRIKDSAYTAQAAMIGDSVAQVTFKGQKSIVSYSGITEANIRTRPIQGRLVALTLAFLPTQAGAELFRDPQDQLWKIRTFSLTEGVTVMGVTTVDKQTLAELESGVPPKKDPIFGFGVLAGTNTAYGGAGIRITPNWFLSANYRLSPMDPDWKRNVLIGVFYFPK